MAAYRADQSKDKVDLGIGAYRDDNAKPWVLPVVKKIFGNVGLPIAQYPYFSKQTKGLDFEGMKAAISAAPDRSIILLHACAHNPTGLAILQRSEISNPPLYGARVASTVLNDPALFAEWEDNLRTMSGRIIEMRKVLRAKLEELGTPGTWNHITDQIGMFSFTGLSEAQVLKLREDAHVYMTKNGRISMAGLNTRNVEYFAKAVDKVVRESQ
uniref:aspartate transaminase n=1 Tax=Colletotrichum fructicola (strain Nara gc5) TaxID=1213859 RepID=L2GDL5_COLFN